MQEMLLKLEDIRVHYGGVKALDGVSLVIDEGEIVALMGPNGAGKSTVLRAIFGLAPIDAGRVLWHEHVIAPDPYTMVRRGVAFVPQGRRVFPNLSVRENLEVGGYSIGHQKEIRARIDELLSLFPMLRTKIHAPSRALSGGQQQMLAIARGLMTDPKVLLLDEPTLGLAPKVVKEVFQVIRDIHERRKISIIVVEHNIQSLLSIAERAYLLDRGKIVAHGLARELSRGKVLKEVFLGKI